MLGVPLKRGREGGKDERREESGSRAARGSCGFGTSLDARGRPCLPWHPHKSSSHHQHKAAGRRTGQKKPIYPLCVCVCVCFCSFLCRSVSESGRERRVKEKLDYSNRERGMGTRPSCSVPLKGNEEVSWSKRGVSSVHALPGQQTDIIS